MKDIIRELLELPYVASVTLKADVTFLAEFPWSSEVVSFDEETWKFTSYTVDTVHKHNVVVEYRIPYNDGIHTIAKATSSKCTCLYCRRGPNRYQHPHISHDNFLCATTSSGIVRNSNMKVLESLIAMTGVWLTNIDPISGYHFYDDEKCIVETCETIINPSSIKCEVCRRHACADHMEIRLGKKICRLCAHSIVKCETCGDELFADDARFEYCLICDRRIYTHRRCQVTEICNACLAFPCRCGRPRGRETAVRKICENCGCSFLACSHDKIKLCERCSALVKCLHCDKRITERQIIANMVSRSYCQICGRHGIYHQTCEKTCMSCTEREERRGTQEEKAGTIPF